MNKTHRLFGLVLVFIVSLHALPAAGRWTGAWVSAQQVTEPANLPPAPGLAQATLRQVIQPSLGGTRLRVTFSNLFGRTPLAITVAHVAVAGSDGAIEAGSDHALAFHGNAGVTIQPGASMISDPVDFAVAAERNLAITAAFAAVPTEVTGHPGSRTTSFLQAGDAVAAVAMPQGVRADHWYVLSAVDVWTDGPSSAIVVLGDSITDGRGSTTNHNDRWPNRLAQRLHANPPTAQVAVLNQGIGGNRLLRDGLGPHALARFDRDVLASPGVRWLIVLEGINDLGSLGGPHARSGPVPTAADIIAALEQIAVRAHSHGLKVFAGTIMPYEGASYFSAEGEASRQSVNAWIRTSGAFDAVIDFDRVARDPAHPTRLAAAVDGGDHLHPSASGYEIMAAAVDLDLFTRE